MRKHAVLGAGHWIRKRRGTWIIAVPPEVRKLLGVTHRMRLYWSARRSGEAVLATKAKPTEGSIPARQLAHDLAAALAEIDALRHRDATRDRGVYAEGFAHGYLQAYERLIAPDGPSAERGRRRALWRWAYPDAAYLTDPKQLAPRPAPSPPRHNARTRRAKRDADLTRRGVEVHTLDHYVTPSAPPDPARQSTRRGAASHVQSPALSDPPASIDEGADTSGAELPGVPLEH